MSNVGCRLRSLGDTVSKRSIDHLVLPVSALGVARTRLSALGFTVAPEALHPFGTANACVFFADGTYLEPLEIANRRLAAAAARKGNVFAGRTIDFRRIRNREGLSAVVLASEDAVADHQFFIEAGLSGGDPLEFARPMTRPDGGEVEARFRLAFAADPAVRDFYMFTCQRLVTFPADRSDFTRHSNGVIGLKEVVLAAPEPDVSAPLLGNVLGPPLAGEIGSLKFQAANGSLRVLSPEAMEAEFAIRSTASLAEPIAQVVVFRTADLAVTEIELAANDVAFVRRNGHVLVSPAPGQGVVFGFEE